MKKIINILLILLVFILIFGSGFKYVYLDEYEESLLILINQERANNCLDELVIDIQLMKCADSRSTDMIERNYFSHYTPEGNRVRYGEVLAKFKCDITQEQIIEAWLSSQSHREVILNSNYKRIGISIAEKGDIKIITILFASKGRCSIYKELEDYYEKEIYDCWSYFSFRCSFANIPFTG